MKSYIIIALLLTLCLSVTAQGYEVKINFKPLTNQYVYVGHYYGQQLLIVDSVLLNDRSEGVFRGNKKLGDGLYFIGAADRRYIVPFVVDKNYQFSISADTAQLTNVVFKASPENSNYAAYQAYLRRLNKKLEEAAAQLFQKKGDTLQVTREIKAIQDSIHQYRKKTMQQFPNSFLAAMLKAMLDPEVPQNHQGAAKDSLFAYKYTKAHYWDHLSFYDDRMARTPFLEAKLDRYFTILVYPDADSVNKEIDWMMGYASINDFTQKFLLEYFMNRYGSQKQAWQDEVYLNLYEKYINGKSYAWLTPAYQKKIADRAYSIMATHIGKPAPEITGKDLNGKKVSLSASAAPYTLLVIWDATCPHCRELLPQMQEKYKADWKEKGLRIFALSLESTGSPEMWQQFVSENKLTDWTHVYYSKADAQARTDAGLTGYDRLYDVQRLPTLYLLDNEKRIIARKISEKQVDEILKLKEKM